MTLSVEQSGLLTALTHERLNERDAELQQRGYYEMLTRSGSNTVPGHIGQVGEEVQSLQTRLKRYRERPSCLRTQSIAKSNLQQCDFHNEPLGNARPGLYQGKAAGHVPNRSAWIIAQNGGQHQRHQEL